jgi:DNA-binding response OmpR family regulator
MSAGRVIVVDDDRSLCDTLGEALTKRGFAVECRTSPAAALELLGAADWDVVVTDLRMGAASGLDLCARRSRSTRSPSGSSVPSSVAACGSRSGSSAARSAP